MATVPNQNTKPYWWFQLIGWLLFALFNFGTRISIFPDAPSRWLEGYRFAFALLATFPLHIVCRQLWVQKARIILAVCSCLVLACALALTGEWLSELVCSAIWHYPRKIAIGFLAAESSHFFVTLCCWCALYFSANAYFEAEEQARQAVATKVAQREAELEVLRFQIQPAFFNIGLDRISDLVNAGNTRQASLMVSQFGGLLRSILDERDILLSDLASELVHVGDYLKIARNQSIAPLEIDLDCELEPNQILIPRWLLIPLIEALFDTEEATGRLSTRYSNEVLSLELQVKGGSLSSSTNFAGPSARLDEVFGERSQLYSEASDHNRCVIIRMPLVCAINS